MEEHKFWDIFFVVGIWVIVFALIYGAAAVWITAPSGVGPVSQLIGVFGAQMFYSLLYGLESLLLAFAVLTGRGNLKKGTLVCVYLTGFFTSILIVCIAGFSVGIIDNLVIACSAAACWLYYKFKTEYLTVKEFNEVVNS